MISKLGLNHQSHLVRENVTSCEPLQMMLRNEIRHRVGAGRVEATARDLEPCGLRDLEKIECVQLPVASVMETNTGNER